MATLGDSHIYRVNPERVSVASTDDHCNSFRVARKAIWISVSQGFKANPGLELANAFGVKGKL